MIAIDRKSRRIHIRSSQNNQNEDEPDVPQILSYDHLILATGTQYEVPYPSGLCANRSDDELREECKFLLWAFSERSVASAHELIYYQIRASSVWIIIGYQNFEERDFFGQVVARKLSKLGLSTEGDLLEIQCSIDINHSAIPR